MFQQFAAGEFEKKRSDIRCRCGHKSRRPGSKRALVRDAPGRGKVPWPTERCQSQVDESDVIEGAVPNDFCDARRLLAHSQSSTDIAIRYVGPAEGGLISSIPVNSLVTSCTYHIIPADAIADASRSCATTESECFIRSMSAAKERTVSVKSSDFATAAPRSIESLRKTTRSTVSSSCWSAALIRCAASICADRFSASGKAWQIASFTCCGRTG